MAPEELLPEKETYLGYVCVLLLCNSYQDMDGLQTMLSNMDYNLVLQQSDNISSSSSFSDSMKC